jgi:YggT family protein
MNGGAEMSSLGEILLLILNVAKYIIIIHIIMSWLINFQVLNLRQPLVAQLWYGLNRALDPVYSRVRQYLPRTTGIDFAPLIVLVAILALEIVVTKNF